jgi:hypothetical protein
MTIYHGFEGADVDRADREGYVNFAPLIEWPRRLPGGLRALQILAHAAAAWLRVVWGINSVRVAREAVWVQVAKRDAQDAALGLSIFLRSEMPRRPKALFVS